MPCWNGGSVDGADRGSEPGVFGVCLVLDLGLYLENGERIGLMTTCFYRVKLLLQVAISYIIDTINYP